MSFLNIISRFFARFRFFGNFGIQIVIPHTYTPTQLSTPTHPHRFQLSLSFFLLLFSTLTSILILSHSPLLALPNYKSLQYAVKDGLPTSLTKSVYQDEQGFVWIATDNGLVKFSSDKFVSYKYDLKTNYIKNIYQTEAGELLAVHDMGLHKITNERNDTQFEELAGGTIQISHYALNFPKTVYETSPGELWISEPGSVVKLVDKRITRYYFAEKVRTTDFKRSFLFAEIQGRLVISSQRGYLFYYNPQDSLMHQLDLEQKEINTISALYQDSNHQLIMGTSDGIYVMKDIDFTNDKISFKKISNLQDVSVIKFDNQKTLFVGTWFNGLFYSDGSDLNNLNFESFPNLNLNVINDINIGNNNVWIASDNGIGLLWLPFFSTPDIEGNSDFIQYMTDDSKGNVYYTNGEFIRKIQKNDNKYFSETILQSNEIIQSFFPDSSHLWLGYRDNAIEKINPDGSRKRWNLPLHGNRMIRNIVKDSKNYIWFTKDGLAGIYRINCKNDSLKYFDEKSGIEGFINGITETEDGYIYLCGESDSTYLYQWDSEKEKFRNISPKINHPYNTSINIQYNVFCIQSKDNKLFLGTNVGLWMIDRNTYDFKFMNESRDIMIKSMKFDNKGNLWMGSDVGVLRYYQGEFMRYEESDGLLSNTMSFWSIALDNENHAWFGGSRGISRWAKIVNINHKTPKPVFTKILINGENYQDRLKKSNSFAHASYLEISFVSLDYPHNRTRYQYRIASRGENWSDKISNNEFFLPKLHSGDFVLEVRAKNPGYLYSDVQSLKLKVSRPWYLTIWGVILLFLIVWIFYEIIKLVSGELKEKKYLEKLQITLYKMSREAFLKQNIENMYHTIHQVFDQVGKYDNFSVILYNNKDNSLDYVYDSDDANSKYRNPISKNLIHKLFTEKRSLMMNRDEINAHLAEIGKSYHMNEIQSWLGVPFSTDKDIFGALVVQSHHEANYFGQKEIDILEYISNHISQVIYRIRMENALEENERKLRSLINSMPEYVLFKNEEGTIEIANNAICEFLGIKDASSLIGKKYHELESILPVHMKKYLSKEIKNDEKVWNGRSIARYEGLVRNSKGEFFALDITKVPLYGHDRGRIGMVMISHDVTDRKKSENLLQGALEKANVATKTKSEFIANMSHEIRTPLNGVIGMTDMLLESKLNTTQEDYAEVIKNSADYLLNIVNEILDFSKIEAGKMELENIPFNLNNVIENISHINEYNINKKGLKAGYFLDPAIPWELIGDPSKLKHILVNLISNSIKFTDKGRLEISAKPILIRDKSVKIRFEVADTGIGIKEEQKKSIFNEFTQADNSITRKFGGTGLGLAISSKLVAMMGGTIEIESPNGLSKNELGTTFIFILSFKINANIIADDPNKKVQISDKEEDNSQPMPMGLRVLVVDDNKINQKVAAAILRKVKAKVFFANNGLEAVDFVKNNEIDLILMDVYMPEMDGLEATQQIRYWQKKTEHAHIPIFGITASVVKEDIDRCFDSGMDVYLPKPIRISDFLKKYREYLS